MSAILQAPHKPSKSREELWEIFDDLDHKTKIRIAEQLLRKLFKMHPEIKTLARPVVTY